jgi:hypothetical protein
VQSSIPVVTALLATVWMGERLTAPRALGIGLAVAGVLLVISHAEPDEGARDPLIGNLLMFASVVERLHHAGQADRKRGRPGRHRLRLAADHVPGSA